MKIALSGGTGFIGKQLSAHLLRSGNELIVISRNDFAGGSNQLAKVINSADVIINLAGATVLQRWNDRNKQLILTSRVETTRLLVEAVGKNLPGLYPKIFINASAIGIYSNSGSHDETSSELSNDFLAMVCKAWESETTALRNEGIRLCIIRIGIVLGTTG
ncbi:MAG TPA: NAD-dependent epimerase/dehydratase family protein, partial [Prolixibacteraceae bacterium]